MTDKPMLFEAVLQNGHPDWPRGREDCERCKGTGVWQYDHNHGSPCPDCCEHRMGWWKLSEPYGASEERYAACYRPGCGTTITHAEWDALPEELQVVV